MTSSSRRKTLYKGTFNWSGEVIEEFVRADNERVAFRLLTARLAMLKGRTSYDIRQRFDGKKNNFTIEVVPESSIVP